MALAFQVVFLIISRSSRQYRAMMIPSVIEKFSFVIALAVLFIQHRVALAMMMFAGGIDLLLGVLFVISYLKTSEAESSLQN